MGSGTTLAAALKLGRRFIGADVNLGAVQTATKRLLISDKEPSLNFEGIGRSDVPGFELYNVNHYDVFRNPIQAKELLLDALEVQKLELSSVFDGEKDGRMVKIMPVNRIATRADLNELIAGFDYKAWERRQAEHPNRPVEKLNVGDEKLTSNDDIREFNRLDTPTSEKQFILLVNKGREGWNCRSLFGVGLFREPKSKVFVLQATMRCLRAIGQAQYTGHVFLSDDNMEILNDELQQNFRISAAELQKVAGDKERVQIKVVEPPVKIKLVRVRKEYNVREKTVSPGQTLFPELSARDKWSELVEKYRLLETQQEGLTPSDAVRASSSRTFDLTERREKQVFSRLSIVGEVARYLNQSPLEIESLLDATTEGVEKIVAITNEFNELLYDEIIPRLFRMIFELDESERNEEHEVQLIKLPASGYYEITAAKDKIVRSTDAVVKGDERDKSFHLDTYCFDSNSERTLFWDLLREKRVKKIYFTGMLTHGQSDFFIQYIDPDSHTVRSYYPDFVFVREEPDGNEKYVIVEVKGDHQIDAAVVRAKKDFAEQIAVASGMEYQIIKSSDADARSYRMLL